MTLPLLEYSTVNRISGPLLVVQGVAGVGWDEFALIRLPGGEVRHGLVLEVDRDLAVVEVLEGTAGIDPTAVSVAFDGAPLQIPVGPGWLGRVCNGRGEPLDGGPPVLGRHRAPVTGNPLNPTMRQPPSDPVLTGVSAIDGLTTLVRGQKLPVFSVAGLPHLELAAQIAAQATAGDSDSAGAGDSDGDSDGDGDSDSDSDSDRGSASQRIRERTERAAGQHDPAGGEGFSVVVAAMGLTRADAGSMRDTLEERSAAGELVLLLNTADDPVVERILTPRLALTIAEHLAFEMGRHVLVVAADMTSYCEALREVSAARGEVPARQAYPGYLYSDLASLYERCGRVRGRPGSVTVLPVLTMPAGDITHPVPDLTGYITEGQIVLSAEMYARGVYPPMDPLSSLSRLMRHGAGPGRTREDHLDVAAQTLAALARARRAGELAELIGLSALSATDQRYLEFSDALQHTFLNQRSDETRSLDETLKRAWQALATLPRRELTMLPAAQVAEHLDGGGDG